MPLSPITPGNPFASAGKSGGGSLEFSVAALFTFGAKILLTFIFGREKDCGWTPALGGSRVGIGTGPAGVSAGELGEVLATGSTELALPDAVLIVLLES